MGAVRRHHSPTPVEGSPRVAWAPEVVTGISRPLSRDEQWTLWYFEEHAARCNHCRQPLAVSKLGKKLCDEGHDLAIDVARLLFRRRDGHVYSRTKDEHQEVRLEMPADYVQTESLLSAIHRCMRRGEKFLHQAKSLDRNYFVSPRHHNDKHDHSRPNSRHTSPSRQRPAYDVKVVTPGHEGHARTRGKRDSVIEGLDTSKRGSLYDLDMGELEKELKREQKIRYNLEVRSPTFGQSARRFAVAG